ncbi:IucC family-domain-containing protein [Aspergillus lucknowensis]|uniref:IucC family-domain-containing protein n=1 Tax=Aspergillus lucknowensis TaxID=176173 RepID=A0ABR4LDH2_9EURO
MLKPLERKRAELASLARVAACLINERLVTSTFTDNSILLSHPETDETICVSLPRPPQFHEAVHASELSGKILYNDRSVLDGAGLMRIYGKWAKLNNERIDQICREFENSVQNLEKAYRQDWSLTIDSPAWAWEQAVVEGHGMHPWHRCRYPLVDDFETASIHFVSVPRAGLTLVGDYEGHISKLIPTQLNHQGDDQVIFPVHEYQLPNVKNAFPNARVLPCTISGRPQSSVRSISLPGADVDFCIKVPLAVKITSIVRTIRPWAITIGYRLEPILTVIENAAKTFGGSLRVIREVAAAASSSEHLGCIIRQSTESLVAETGDRIIVCAAVAEHIHDVWPDITTPEAKLDLLRDFCVHLFRAVLPSVLLHGFALQAHMQNLLIRLDPVSRDIRGFFVRDLGSFRVHRETFSASTSLDVDTAWVLTKSDSLEKVYRYILSVIHGDVASMIRALQVGMPGWKVARGELEKVIPAGDEMARRTWLESPECMSRAHLSMQLFGVERECTMTSIPNRFYYCQQGVSE